VLDRFCETLDALAAVVDDLEPECQELQNRLHRFLEPPRETDDDEDFGVGEEGDEFDDDSLPF
jgi:hypothetical protein